MNARQFVIPDIHGCALTLRSLLDNVIRLQRSDSLYLLGDVIDRGPRSKEVLDIIRLLDLEGYDIHCVRGNHEEMLLKSCLDRNYFRLWMLNGGRATLKSFGVEDSCDIPISYRACVERFPYFIKLDGFVLVHGGLNFEIPDPFTDIEAMLWSRNKEVAKERIGGRRVITGHTPTNREEILDSLTKSRIILDNGCVYKGEPGLGSLAALELYSMSLYFHDNIDI